MKEFLRACPKHRRGDQIVNGQGKFHMRGAKHALGPGDLRTRQVRRLHTWRAKFAARAVGEGGPKRVRLCGKHKVVALVKRVLFVEKEVQILERLAEKKRFHAVL